MNNFQIPAEIHPEHLVFPNLDIFYPAVSGISSANKINNAIIELEIKLLQQQGFFENPMTDVTGQFEVKTNERNVLSLSLNNYAFAGGAHGLTIIKSLTFDLPTGRIYQLADLFKPGSDYVKKLSAIVAQQIKTRNITLLEPFTGIRPDQDFYIADKALVLYFQLYELTAYVFGFPMFPISVYEIQDLINEQGPLGEMAENN